MKREEIDRVLDTITARANELRANPTRHNPAEFDVLLLAEVVRDQERRLRVLEPCPLPKFPGAPHVWVSFEDMRCQYCGVKQ